jgi:hypothetical protein
LDAWGPPGGQAGSEMTGHSAEGTDVSPNAQGGWAGSPTSPVASASARSSLTRWPQAVDDSSHRWSSRSNSQANFQSSRNSNSSIPQTQRQSMEPAPAPVTYSLGPDQPRPMISAAALAAAKSKHTVNGKEDTGWGISPRESVLLDHNSGWREQPGKTRIPPPRKGDPAWMKWGRDARGAPLTGYGPSRAGPAPPTAPSGSHPQRLSNRLNDILNQPGQPQPPHHANTMPARGSRAQPGWPSNSTDGWHRSRRSSQSAKREETWGADDWGAPTVTDIGWGRSSKSGTRRHQDDWDDENEFEAYDDGGWETVPDDRDAGFGQAGGSGGGWGNQDGDDWENGNVDEWGGGGGAGEGGGSWDNGGMDEWDGGHGWGKSAKSDKLRSSQVIGRKRGNGQDAWATPISQGWDQVDEWGTNGDPRHSRASKTRSSPQAPPPLSAATPGASYPLPSKTMAYAMRGEKYTKIHDYVMPRKPMGDYANINFNESHGAALKDLERALYSRSRPAKERIHWAFSPDKDERVASLLAWIQLVSVGLGSFGVRFLIFCACLLSESFVKLHKFLQTRERGALISNADYVQSGKPDEPTFDWLTFDQLQPTMDKIMQESVATYNPALHVIVFVILPSKTKNSIAVWRRKIIIPYNLRTAYVAEIKQAVKMLKKDYVCMVEEYVQIACLSSCLTHFYIL